MPENRSSDTVIHVARDLGFCFGVSRALAMAEKLWGQGVRAHTWGPLVHNRAVTDFLQARGITAVGRLEDCRPGWPVILRSHGAGQAETKCLAEAGHTVIDATCPCVERIHKLVREMEEEGRQVFILGDATHPEVLGTAGWCECPVIVPDGEALAEWFQTRPGREHMPAAIVAQTTARRDVWEKCTQILKKLCTNVKIIDTMCNATVARQTEADRLARFCDGLVVAGDRGSSNTRKILEVCAAHCPDVILVERAGGWPRGWLRNKKNVGFTAGASTPPWIIEEVYQAMSEEIKNGTADVTDIPVEPENGGSPEACEPIEPMAAPEEDKPAAADPDGEESFAALLEKSLKTITTGDKVRGIVTAVTPTEIHVDLGTKHAGYIPVDELSYDPDAKVEDMVHVGDEIETYAMRVNDVEGTVALSKRRLDTVKSWEDVELARENHAVVSGIVTEENKGGVVVSVNGVRVFVPASQTGLPKDAPMSSLIKRRVKLRVTEVNRARRRVVGSIRAAQAEERRGLAEAVWENIAIGKHFNGVVKSLTSYGAFVDIGGVDGMVHISELSWSRVSQASDVVSVGDDVDVYVIGFDKEKRKISLGYKKLEEDPWRRFTEAFREGSEANVKVVKLMPFGAFAEIIPGVDGLIHIGQITDRRIGKPGDVLHEGQQVDVKIIHIDHEKKKISLSIRALMEPTEAAEREELENALLPDEVIAVSGEAQSKAASLEAEPAEETIEAAETVEETVVEAGEKTVSEES